MAWLTWFTKGRRGGGRLIGSGRFIIACCWSGAGEGGGGGGVGGVEVGNVIGGAAPLPCSLLAASCRSREVSLVSVLIPVRGPGLRVLVDER